MLIFEELMDIAAGDRWQRYKLDRELAGKTPVIPAWTPPTLRNRKSNSGDTKLDVFDGPNVGKTGAAAVLP